MAVKIHGPSLEDGHPRGHLLRVSSRERRGWRWVLLSATPDGDVSVQLALDYLELAPDVKEGDPRLRQLAEAIARSGIEVHRRLAAEALFARVFGTPFSV